MTAWKPALLLWLGCLVAGPAAAVMHEETISYRDGDVTLKGYLYWDDAFTGKRPGVMVAHEWWGLNDFARLRAEMLAESGYVAFAADLYGDGRNTRKPAQAQPWRDALVADPAAWQRRAKLGLDQLAGHGNVDASRLAAIGYSLGGATVMQLVYTDAAPLGVVSVCGPLDPPEPAQAANAASGRVLVLHGAADPFVPPDRAQAFTQALSDAGVDWEMISYGGAPHGFANPYADGYGIDGLSYHEAADRRAWLRTLAFLRDLFGEAL